MGPLPVDTHGDRCAAFTLEFGRLECQDGERIVVSEGRSWVAVLDPIASDPHHGFTRTRSRRARALNVEGVDHSRHHLNDDVDLEATAQRAEMVESAM